jgi:FkbM family methyltransferase
MLKKLFKSFFLNTIIWEYLITLKNKFNLIFAKNYAQDHINSILKKHIDYKNGFYIEIGANDGVRQSNTLYFEKFKNWRGILVEPSKRYNNLIKNRKKKNYFFNVACCSFESINKYKSLYYADLHTLSKNNIKQKDLESFQKEVETHFSGKVEEFKIEQIPLNELLIKSKAPEIIDFFSLDVEGDELNILKGINFDDYKFKFLLIEGHEAEVTKFLLDKNYKVLKKLKYDILYHYLDNVSPYPSK